MSRWALAALLLSGCEGLIDVSGVLASPDAAATAAPADASPPTSADAAVSPDTSRPDAESPADTGVAIADAGVAAPDAAPLPDAAVLDRTVPIFVAQGMVGRTTISCDDGQSWIADRAWDTEGDARLCGSTQPVLCYAEGSECGYVGYDGMCHDSAPCDCGHSPGFGKGVVHGAGLFVATWGWGHPGSARVSRDGVEWTETLGDDQFGGMAYGSGRFVLASRTPQYSPDGLSWTPGREADFRDDLGAGAMIWSVRRFAYADVLGGRFIAVASGNTDRDMLISSDGGESWWRPSMIPEDCAHGVSDYGDILSGNGVVVIVGQSAHACRSTDGGDTWTVSRVADTQILSHGIFNGSEFWFWADDGNRYSSADGQTWTPTRMLTPRRIGPVARADNGTLVAVSNVWEGYERQRFLRSVDDGLTWEQLAPGRFAASHPIFHLSFGQAQPSAACPAR